MAPVRHTVMFSSSAKCSRCEYLGKECGEADFGGADAGQQLYELIAQDPLDIFAIKVQQRIARDDLAMALQISAITLADVDMEDNAESEYMLDALQSATDSAVPLARALDNTMDRALVKGVRHTVEAVSSLLDGVTTITQPQFAEDAAEIIGLV
ncbi:uncharacterized protein DNG_01467 [Cephalotrichum gorgonifer]|uniref:Uncharacterized protein n=1 Tax=Cephalotrichum gorgonifer TaxID=2041049 RepID=A0AAE8MSN7_9PEZI|nr:uncharacterized protein DNG_01467 [Cephalotrichum gorgonifer]